MLNDIVVYIRLRHVWSVWCHCTICNVWGYRTFDEGCMIVIRGYRSDPHHGEQVEGTILNQKHVDHDCLSKERENETQIVRHVRSLWGSELRIVGIVR